MSETWMRGWLPRVTRNHQRGLAATLEPATLFDQQHRPAAALVDVHDALGSDELLLSLRSADLPYVVDTGSWRFADARTFDAPRWTGIAHAPPSTFKPSRDWVQEYVGADLRVQDACNPAAFVLPSWFIPDPDLAFDVATWTLDAARQLKRGSIALRPFTALVCADRRHPAALGAVLEALDEDVTGIFLQVDNINPRKDSIDKVTGTLSAILTCGRTGRPVVAQALAALAPLLHGLGVDATTSGPADNEEFASNTKIKGSVPRKKDPEKSGGGSGIRIHYTDVQNTIGGEPAKVIRTDRSLVGHFHCRRSCCRFDAAPELTTAAADLHSIVSRVMQVDEILDLPPALRLDRARRMVGDAATRVDKANTALAAAGVDLHLRRTHLEHMAALLESAAHERGAA